MYSILLAAAMLVACNTPVTPPDNGGNNGGNTEEKTRDVMTYITTADNTMHFDGIAKDFAEGMNMSPEITLTLNPNVRYQEFDGFGAAITGAAAYNLMQMSQANRTKLLRETFDVKEGMGYSYVRVPIGGSDFKASTN